MVEEDNKKLQTKVPPSGGGGGMFYGASNIIFERAKKLRNNVTNEEMILWGILKDQFPALKFRRQHPVSNYIADFYCHSQKLIIEIDGSIHDVEEIKINDGQRQKDLESLGIKVIRFTNNQIRKNLNDVLQQLKIILNNYKLKFPL